MAKKVEISGGVRWDTSKLRAGLAKSESMIKTSAGRIKGIAGKAGLIGAAIGLTKGIGATNEYIEQLDTMSRRLGISAEQLQRLDFVASQNKSSMDELVDALTKVNRIVANPSDEQTKALRELGIAAEDFRKLEPEEQLAALADGFANATDRGKGLNALYKLMEDQAKRLVPLLENGGEAIRQLAEETPGIISNHDVTRAGMMADELDRAARAARAGAKDVTEMTMEGGIQSLLVKDRAELALARALGRDTTAIEDRIRRREGIMSGEGVTAYTGSGGFAVPGGGGASGQRRFRMFGPDRSVIEPRDAGILANERFDRLNEMIFMQGNLDARRGPRGAMRFTNDPVFRDRGGGADGNGAAMGAIAVRNTKFDESRRQDSNNLEAIKTAAQETRDALRDAL